MQDGYKRVMRFIQFYMTKYQNNNENHIYSKMGGMVEKRKTCGSWGSHPHCQFKSSPVSIFFCSGPKPLLIWLSERPVGKKRLHRERKYEQGARAQHCFCTGCKSSHLRGTATREISVLFIKNKSCQ